MFADTQPNGELAHQCVTAMCLAHQRKVWTGGDAHEWRHGDNYPCAGQRVEHYLPRVMHSTTCTCWECQGDPFAGIPQVDDDPFASARIIGPAEVLASAAAANVVVVDPADLAGFLADVNRRELERRLAELRNGYQPDLFDVATTELVEPGMNGVLF